jgi:hypothetical protein
MYYKPLWVNEELLLWFPGGFLKMFLGGENLISCKFNYL